MQKTPRWKSKDAHTDHSAQEIIDPYSRYKVNIARLCEKMTHRQNIKYIIPHNVFQFEWTKKHFKITFAVHILHFSFWLLIIMIIFI